MNIRNFLLILMVVLFFSGCVIWSFYPLYTEKDLFANEILTGNWTNENDSLNWSFEHPIKDSKTGKLDHTKYVLSLTDCDSAYTTYDVHVIKLDQNYYLDFYLTEIITSGSKVAGENKDISLWPFHIVPVHTFAKLTIAKDTLQIYWFDKEWLYEKIKEKKVKIRHEYSDNNLLLTAKTADLQKLVTKYANTPEAFKDGLAVTLIKK